MSAQDRWWAKVRVTNACWTWTGRPNSDGYGHLRVDGRMTKAHRFGYEMLVGPIPSGLVIDHLCRNRLCVNPAHLEPVTSGTNTLRGTTIAAREAAQSRCIAGHELAGENLRVDRRGKRVCRTCNRLNSARFRISRGIGSRNDRELIKQLAAAG